MGILDNPASGFSFRWSAELGVKAAISSTGVRCMGLVWGEPSSWVRPGTSCLLQKHRQIEERNCKSGTNMKSASTTCAASFSQ